MPTFRFNAVDLSGREVWGFVDASTEADANERIRGMGYFPFKTTKIAEWGGLSRCWLTLRNSFLSLVRPATMRHNQAGAFKDPFIQPESEEELNAIISVLIRRGLSPEQVDKARQQSKKHQVALLETLVALNSITPMEILSAASEYYGLEHINLTNFEGTTTVLKQVRESTVREFFFLPLVDENGVLKIAVNKPGNVKAVQSVLNREVLPVLALRRQLAEAINRCYSE